MQRFFFARHVSYRSLFAFITLLISMLSTTAQAQEPLACGVYTNTRLNLSLHILSSNTFQKQAPESHPDIYYYEVDRSANKVRTYQMDIGSDDSYKLSPDGKALIDSFGSYELKKPLPCEAPVTLPVNAVWPLCFEKSSACFMASLDVPLSEQETMCASGLYFMCRQLPNEYRQRAKLDVSPFAASAPLPAADLASLRKMCVTGRSSMTCKTAAEEYWIAGQYLETRAMMTYACGAPINDSRACIISAGLAPLSEAVLAQIKPAKTLPQGTFTSPYGLMDHLTFGSDGMVKDKNDMLNMKAHISDGLVMVAHNKGGFFTYKTIGDDYLLGVDYWSRLTLLTRQHD